MQRFAVGPPSFENWRSERPSDTLGAAIGATVGVGAPRRHRRWSAIELRTLDLHAFYTQKARATGRQKRVSKCSI
ncbi:MAG: hypothetical protein ABIR33_02195 [Pyrinomonadaceae bacterium]